MDSAVSFLQKRTDALEQCFKKQGNTASGMKQHEIENIDFFYGKCYAFCELKKAVLV